MKLNQEWKQQWDDIEVPQEKIETMITKTIEQKTKSESSFQKIIAKGKKLFSRFSRKTWIISSVSALAVLVIVITVVSQNQMGKSAENASMTADEAYTGSGMTAMEKAPSEVESDQTNSEAAAKKQESSEGTTAVLDKTAQFYNYYKQTTDFSVDVKKLETLIKENGGYIETSNKGLLYDDLQQAYYTIRIPEENSQNFLDKLAEIGETTDESIQTENYATEYSDNDSRIKALETEESALLELLQKSDTMDDMLKIQKRLTTIRSEREALVRSNKGIDNKVDYLTINLTLNEADKVEKKQESPSLVERIQGNLEQQKKFWQNLGENLIVFLASNILYFVLIIAGLLGLRYYYKKRKLK